MTSSDLIAVTLTTVAVLQAGMVGWVVHRQHSLVIQMTRILASRSMSEYASAERKLSQPPPPPQPTQGEW